MSSAEQIIAHLQLQPLIAEGGYFAHIWRATHARDAAPPAATAIYFLLTIETFSAFHRFRADQIWHFYAGDRVEHGQLRANETPFFSGGIE